MVTEYQLSRRERMNEYLNSLKEEAKRINGDESVVYLAQDFLTLLTHKLAQRNLVLEVPDCSPNNGSQGDFNIKFFWEKDEDYLECEIFYAGIIEFFYRNSFTHKVWIWECNFAMCDDDLSPNINSLSATELFEKLSLFVE